MGSGSSAAKYERPALTVADAEPQDDKVQQCPSSSSASLHVRGAAPVTYRQTTRRKPTTAAAVMPGAMALPQGVQSQQQASALPQNWRTKWERPAAVFSVRGAAGPRYLPPLRSTGTRALPSSPPECLSTNSAVARMAAEYWRNEQRAGSVPPALAGAPSPGSTAATSTTQSWNSGASPAFSAASGV
mmetsp:Transcript_31703/g.74237  ORF Transcript_31703/g.74237 Transcript_31703/m.74237 type:complete len:187 (+) Transcript_31703:47-607(+)